MAPRGNVLVVDDEINLCRIIGAKLAKSGYSVTAVHDGAQAVEKVRESDFDVVLLDLILPKMDGLAALAEIRNIRRSLPVIVMTACGNAEAAEQARNYGISAYVNKPFDLDSLVALVSNMSQADNESADRPTSNSTVLFSRDQPVTIEIQNGPATGVYQSKICAKDEHTLTLLAPQGNHGDVDIPSRALVRVGLGARDAYYSFCAQAVVSDQGSQRVLVLEKPGVIYRTQRRQHPRLGLQIPIRYAPGQEGAQHEALDFRPGETRDLSAGGACILVGERIEPGAILTIELRPGEEAEKIGAVARVLRATQADQGWLLGCQFVLADPSLHSLLED
ncbi:MAG: response regulator [Armatimonadota bacterium]